MPGVPTVILRHVEPAESAAAAARSAGGVTVQAATGPVQFRRTPGEGGSWVDMAVGGTAYFRDVAWEATYTIEATDDGDYWDFHVLQELRRGEGMLFGWGLNTLRGPDPPPRRD